MREIPYVSVCKRGDKPVLKIEWCNDTESVYALTAIGCRTAGAEAFERGHERLQYSSSVHHPRDAAPKFRGSVENLINKGYRDAALANAKVTGQKKKDDIDTVRRMLTSEEFSQELTDVQTAMVGNVVTLLNSLYDTL
jgi:hypothetical protein